MKTQAQESLSNSSPKDTLEPQIRLRLRSLDAMRGFVIASMLLVNMTWDQDVLPAQLFHIRWNDPVQGATFTDLVFPWFVYIAGAAAPLSLQSGRSRGKTRTHILTATGLRATKLYLLGVFLTVASFANSRALAWTDLLSWNILQLLGIAYFFVVLAQLLPIRWRVGLILGVLLAKWGTFLLPYDMISSIVKIRPADGGPIGPGTWAHFDGVKQLLHMEYVPAPSIFSLLIGWLGMCQQYLPLASIGIIGALATERLQKSRSMQNTLTIFTWGLAITIIGAVLQWDYNPNGGGLWGTATVPYSKWLFSPSYCLLAAGTGTVLLAVFFALIDVKALVDLHPLQALGRNALAVYIGAELSFKLLFREWLLPMPNEGEASIAAAIQAWIFHISGSPIVASIGWPMLWLLGWTWFALRLDRKSIYWRV